MGKKKRQKVFKSTGKSIISDEIFIPNHSGDHTAGTTNTPVNNLDLVNKEYVDLLATKGSIQLFLTEDTSDISTYFDLDSTPDIGTEQEITTAISGNSTETHSSYASILSDDIVSNIEIIEAGIYTCHVHASSTAINNTFLCCNFYKRDSGGTETLIGTTEEVELTTSEGNVNMHLQITDDISWTSTDRFITKALVRNSNPSNKSVSLFVKDDNYSRVDFPAFITPGRFLLKTGGTMTGDVNMDGTNKIVFGTGTFIQEVSANVMKIQGNSVVKTTIGAIDKITTGSSGVTVLDNLTVSGITSEAKGFFDTYVGYSGSISADAYAVDGLGTSMSATRGWVAPYDGSIVSISSSMTIVGGVFAAWGIRTRINGSDALTHIQSTATSGDVNGSTTAARGTHTFSAGDVISFFLDETSGISSITNATIHCRVQYVS